MFLISDRSFAISKIINGDYKVFEFEPGVPVEVPNEIGQEYLENYSTKTYIKEFKGKIEEPVETPDEPIEETLNEIGPIDLPIINDPPVEEEIETTIFTEAELNEMEYEDVFGIAKEMGFNPMPNWKKETLIKKIIEAQ